MSTALVIGAGRDIGAAVARRLAADGCDLLLVGRGIEGLERVAAQIAAVGGTSEVLAADVTTEDGVTALVAAAQRTAPAVVVALARTREPWQRVAGLDPHAVGRAVDAHLTHLVALAAVVLPVQRAANQGRWIFVSSLVTSTGGPGQAAYTAHKLAMEGLSRTLALEEGRHGITANVVAPGFVDTDGTREHYPPRTFRALAAMNALGRAGRCEEVAHVVAALAHPLGGFVTGATVPVGGGAELGWPTALLARDPELADRIASSGRPAEGWEGKG